MAEPRARKAARAAGSRTAAPLPAAEPLTGRVPALDPAHAEALREFFDEPRYWLLPDDGLLRLGMGKPVEGAFALDGDGMRLAVRFDATAASARGGDVLRWGDHVGRSRLLAWSLAHEAELVRLSDGLGVSLLPVADDDAGNDGVWLDFSIEDDASHDGTADGAAPPPTIAARGSLRLPASWLPRLAARAEAHYAGEPPPPLGRWRTTPAPVSILFAIPDVSARDWRSLRPGDVVVAGRSGKPPAFQARASRLRWPLTQAPGGWSVAGPAQPVPETQESDKMTETEAETGTTAAPEDPARKLPVRIEFELGRLEMSLGELADLQPGYVFALPSHLVGANVVIRANGRDAGRGEVVAVGDTLGVRLLSWS